MVKNKFLFLTDMTMNPRKKQRVDSQDISKNTVDQRSRERAKENKRDIVAEDTDNSAEDENLDEIMEDEDEDEEGEFEGMLSFSLILTLIQMRWLLKMEVGLKKTNKMTFKT
jgi:hypothetical protein